MKTTGPTIWYPILALSLPFNPSAAHATDRPPATPTPRAQQPGDGTRLSDYASRIAIDRASLGSARDEPPVITTELVRQLASDGLLTVGFPRNRLSPPNTRPTPGTSGSSATRTEEEWREKVLRQKDQLAKIQGDILLLVRVVAVVTTQIFLLVLAAHPQHLVIFFVAAQAAAVAGVRIRFPLGTKADIGGIAPAAPVVGFTWAVTGGTGCGTAAVDITVNGLEYRVYAGTVLVLVAVEAGRLVLRGQLAAHHEGGAKKHNSCKAFSDHILIAQP